MKGRKLILILVSVSLILILFTACEDTALRMDFKTMSGLLSWKFNQKVDAGTDAVADARFGGPSPPFGEGGIDIDGDWMIIGADGENSDRGAVYFFHFENNHWVKKQRITASDAADWDAFGYSVAISGSFAAVGAPFNESTGYVYLYQLNGSAWIESISPFTGPITETNDRFGCTVSMDGDYIVVGDRTADSVETSATNEGAAYIYYRHQGGIDTWGFQDIITASTDAENDDNFGNCVDIKGDYIVAGAFYSDESVTSNTGAAYVFQRNGSVWQRNMRLTGISQAANDYFGCSVAVSTQFIAIGAKGQDTVYTYEQKGTSWTPYQTIQSGDGVAADEFGYTLDIFGSHLLVGSHYHNTNLLSDSGAAYTFFNTSGNWIETNKLYMNDPEVNDNFGHSIAVSGSTVIIGVPYDDDRASDAGSVVIYNFE